MDGRTALQVWLAVLMQASADLLQDQHRVTALMWFHSKRTDCGSFNWICTLLGRDPDKMRTKLVELRQNPRRGKLTEKYGVTRKRKKSSRQAGGTQRTGRKSARAGTQPAQGVHDRDGPAELQVLPPAVGSAGE